MRRIKFKAKKYENIRLCSRAIAKVKVLYYFGRTINNNSKHSRYYFGR
jgi:hypothetical protein